MKKTIFKIKEKKIKTTFKTFTSVGLLLNKKNYAYLYARGESKNNSIVNGRCTTTGEDQ